MDAAASVLYGRCKWRERMIGVLMGPVSPLVQLISELHADVSGI
jgi:hypothetical protein